MAVRLDGAQFGLLLDFFMGQKDILDKKIRVLHSLSFVDDPSRAYRAIRFAVRFGFEIGSHTDRLIKHAESLDLFSRIIDDVEYTVYGTVSFGFMEDIINLIHENIKTVIDTASQGGILTSEIYNKK